MAEEKHCILSDEKSHLVMPYSSLQFTQLQSLHGVSFPRHAYKISTCLTNNKISYNHRKVGYLCPLIIKNNW